MDFRRQLEQTLSGSYAIERELGGGGMSQVFLATELRLNRRVVIKLLSPDLAAGVNADRFEREIQLAASLQQANIVPILTAGEAQGIPYYTMPFVEGESLRARLDREGRLATSTATAVLRDIARALAYAHEHGVVHRDIKPDNVLLSGGTAVVTDFGIAKAITAARTGGGATLTQLGTSIGTPAYMAPEQAAGDPAVDHRADVYAFGCVAYELLTGESPFQGRTPARMLAAHVSEAPKPLAELGAAIPPALAALVTRCLEKDPDRRPQSGADLVRELESIASGATGALDSAVATPNAMLRRNLTQFAAVLAIIVVVARAAVIALGVPEWVFPGAVLVTLLGLPLLLFAWHAQRTRSAPRFTWQRARTALGAALGGFAVLVVAFMVLRALGIGPAGSLLAAGRVEDRGRLIVTAFPSPDSSLGTLVTEAVRTNLGQSRVVSIMPPTAIAAALQRMQRPPASPLTLDLAREIAEREGIKAIVDGAVRSIAGGYVLSLRLVSSDSASELAAYQETANGPEEILRAIDRLTRKLRGRIGESLRAVRASPRLEHVTTRSLEALRIYAEAAKSIDMGGNPIAAAERLREAVAIDTTFAMAYRKLGVALSNGGLPRIRVDSALERAYRFRDHLTERERLLAEGTYFQLGPGRDRRRAIRAYEALLAIDPTESGAANNLASILSGKRDFARAESIFVAQITAGRATAQNYTNLIAALVNNGKVDEGERYNNEYAERFPTSTVPITTRATFLYHRGQLDSMEQNLKALTTSPNPIIRINGFAGLANYSLLRGKLNDMRRNGQEARRMQGEIGGPIPSDPFFDSLQVSQLDLLAFHDTASAVRRMEAALARTDFQARPFEQRPYIGLVFFFAQAGRPARARALLAQHDAELVDTVFRRIREPGRHAALGAIALAEGKFQEALRETWKADTTYDGPDGNCVICVLDDVAWIWSRSGPADSAIHYFERYLALPFLGRQSLDAAQKPHILKRLGELYESKGDKVNAVRRYREFVDLWAHADERLQGQVSDVRARIARLTDVERRG